VSNFRVAARALLESDLRCRCGEENIPGKPAAIQIDDDGVNAGCRTCGHYGPIARFQIPPVHKGAVHDGTAD
jgi:hypothetical protein